MSALHEQFAVKRYADRLSGAGVAWRLGFVGHRPFFDGLHHGTLVARHDRDFIANGNAPGLDTAGYNAALVEFVDRLYRQSQRKVLQGRRGDELIERLQHGRAGMPVNRVGTARYAVAVAGGNRYDRRSDNTEPGEVAGDFLLDVGKACGVIVDAVHLVDDDGDLPHAQEMQQIAVPPCLFADAFGGVDDENGGVGLRRAGDHVAEEFSMAGRVDQYDVARGGAKADLAGVDGDALIALGLQRVEQERPFKRHAAPGADGLQVFQFAFGQAAGFVQQASDQGGFAVIDMADDDDAHQRTLKERCCAGIGKMNVHGSLTFREGRRSEVSGGAEPLERVFGFVIHGAA